MSLPSVKLTVSASESPFENVTADLAVLLIGEADISDGVPVSKQLSDFDKSYSSFISNALALGDFVGKWLQSCVIILPPGHSVKRLMLFGTGKKTDQVPARSRHLGIKVAEEISKLTVDSVVVGKAVTQFFADSKSIEQFGVGLHAGNFKYPAISPKPEDLEKLAKIVTFTTAFGVDGEAKALERATITGRMQNLCRQLQDGPPNIVTPKFVAEIMGDEARAAGLNVEIIGAARAKEIGLAAFLAVAGGSCNEPQLVIVEYKPKNYKKTIALVGKGLCFDTGGLSLKVGGSMRNMKYDMSGAAVTLSSVLAIAEMQIPVHVFAVGALCENGVDAHAYRVDDVIKTYSGKTIEILNTDAEGRVVLSDALFYTAKHLKPDYIIEFSTLTGAMVVSLGHVQAGLFTFHDEKIREVIQAASAEVGEKVWHLPADEEYQEDIKSQFADVSNLGKPPSAGSITAALFLKEFVMDLPFAHIDIAGVANENKGLGFPQPHASAFGVQLATEIARKFSL